MIVYFSLTYLNNQVRYVFYCGYFRLTTLNVAGVRGILASTDPYQRDLILNKTIARYVLFLGFTILDTMSDSTAHFPLY